MALKRPRQDSNLRPLRSKHNALIQLSYGARTLHCSHAEVASEVVALKLMLQR